MSWLAGAFELVSIYMIGNRNRYGFITGIACNVLWIIVAITNLEIAGGLLVVVVPALGLNVRNFIKWGKNNDKNMGMDRETKT